MGGDPGAISLPPSFAQERLWFLWRLEPDSAEYVVPQALRLSGDLDVGGLERALGVLVARHESLRTRFAEVAGRPVQVVEPAGPVRLVAEDVAAGEVEAVARGEAAVPFDLERGPLLRVRLLRVGAGEHVLLLTMHHVVSDGWSQGVLERELGALYGGAELEPLPVQYADYAVWQREWLRGRVLEEQLGYWRERLAGLEPLDLPGDRVRPAVESHRGARVRAELDPELTRGLRELSRREGVTLFMTLLAGFQLVLGRTAGQQDVAVGTVVAGRQRVELEGLIGFFVNTLVLRTGLGGNPSVRELLARVREATLGAYGHQDLPFEKLVQELRPERDPSRHPLFQIAFGLQNAPRGGYDLPGLRVDRLPVATGTSKYDLSLLMTERGERVTGALEYATDLFDEQTARALLDRFHTVLRAMVAGPDAGIWDLPLLAPAERRRVLEDWNQTRVDYQGPGTLHGLVEEQARQRPHATAVEHAGVRLTYGELDRRANQVANRLRRHGLVPETIVGVSAERSFDMVVAALGVLKAGGAYLPLDPAYPPERLALVLEDADCSLVLISGTLTSRPLPAGVQAIDLDTCRDEVDSSPEVPVREEQLAYVIYTSGSTGRPKGVMAGHRGVVGRIRGMIDRLDMHAGSRVLQFFTFGFDASVMETYLALCVGGTLCLADREDMLPGPALVRTLRDLRITWVSMPPSTLALCEPEPLPDLEAVCVGAEACPPGLVARWAPGRRFLNGYGPTEVTIGATMADCDAADARVAIGRPFANTRVYVVDGRGNRCRWAWWVSCWWGVSGWPAVMWGVLV